MHPQKYCNSQPSFGSQGPCLTPLTKIISKLAKNLKIRQYNTMKVLEKTQAIVFMLFGRYCLSTHEGAPDSPGEKGPSGFVVSAVPELDTAPGVLQMFSTTC